MSEIENRVIAALLLSLLALVISVGIVLMYLVVRWRRRQLTMVPRLRRPRHSTAGAPPWASSAALSARPQTWIAIRASRLQSVLEVFELDDPRPCSWPEGLEQDSNNRVYISPPVAGWVLVAGGSLPEPSDDIDACFRFLTMLSSRLGHVHYFHVNHVLQHHAWARLESGRVLRAYAWVGETVWNQGLPTAAERELRMRAYAYGEMDGGVNAFDPPEAVLSNVERLPRLAARWSMDPAAVDSRFWATHPGISGESSVVRLL